LPTALLISIVISNYVFKCALEATVTPITYQVVNGLKRAENEDYYDIETDMTPFSVDV
jgi:queuosine precursor transporter